MARFIEIHFQLLCFMAVIGLLIVIVLLRLAIEKCCDRLFAGAKEKLQPPPKPAHHQNPVTPAPPASFRPAPLPKNPDEELKDWLDAHFDQVMWWKEFWQHEGAGRRTREQTEQAREQYQQEMQRLTKEEAAKKHESIARWVEQGVTPSQAQQKWQSLREEIHHYRRMAYAYQKD